MSSESIILKAPADFHVHLRQGEFSKLVTPHVRKGGFTLAYVMVSGINTIDLRYLICSAESQTAHYHDKTSPGLQGGTAKN